MAGFVSAVDILPILRAFTERYPKISIDLQVTDRLVDLVQDRIDVSLRITGHLDRAVIARRLGAIRSVMCAAPVLMSDDGPVTEPEDLSGRQCVTYGQFGARFWTLTGRARTARVEVSGPLQINDALLLQRAALEGIGIAILPAFAAGRHVTEGRLVHILPDWEPTELVLYAIYASRRNLPLTTRAFIDFAAEEIRRDPWILTGGIADKS